MQFIRTLASSSRLFLRSGTSTEKRLACAFVLILFAQNPPWPLWEFQMQLVALGVVAGLLLTAPKGIGYFRGGALGLLALVCGFGYFFILQGLGGTFRVSSLFFVMTVFLIFRSSPRTGALTFDLLSLSFAAILLVSLVMWLLWQLGLPLPSRPMTYGAWKGEDVGVHLDNFYFFVAESLTLLNRFYSVFDEPGVVGTLAALTLCGLRFDFRLKRSWVLLAGGLVSWSLAFVVLSIAGLMLFKEGVKVKLFLGGVLTLLVGAAVIVFSSVVPSTDSAGLLLLYRIANFSEYGVGSRTDAMLNDYFLDYVYSLRFLFGEGTSFFAQRPELLSGQGAIFYLIEYGVVGMVFLLATYIAVIHSHVGIRTRGWLLLGIFLLSFVQRPHLMTPWQIVLFWAILCTWAEAKNHSAVHLEKD